MAEEADRKDPAHLEALAEVTREYAKYSRTSYGVAFVATGAAVLATVAADVVVHWAWAWFAYLLLPAAWLLFLASARAYYQRHGTVIEPEQRVAGRGWILAFVYFTCASSMTLFAGRAFLRGRGDWAGVLGTLLAIFALVAVPLLTAEIVRGKVDAYVTFSLVAIASPAWRPLPAPAGSELDNLNLLLSILRGAVLVVVSVGAILLVVAGARDHARYRALERRLTWTKGAA